MDISDIRAVDDLFTNLYPFIAGQVLEYFKCRPGLGVELGPFAPGISIEVARRCPDLRFVVGTGRDHVDDYFREAVTRTGLGERFEVRPLDLYALPFPPDSIDLAIFRGGLFFWDDEAALLREVARVLRPGGVGFVGGGFGAGTPDPLVDAIVAESRELNRRLGKRNLSVRRTREIVAEAGLAERTTIDHRRGLWLIIRVE